MAINENDDFYQGGGGLDIRRPLKIFAPVNLLNRLEVNAEVSGDNSKHFVEVSGTLPASPNTSVEGYVLIVTSAGSAPHAQYASSVYLLEGYTGSGTTRAKYIENGAAGTGADLFNGNGNLGLDVRSFGTTIGTNAALWGIASGGNVSVGVVGRSTLAKNGATNIGGAFFGRNTGTTPIQIGIYAGLNGGNPTLESAAAISDNAAVAAPIHLFRNNGTTVWSVQDGGSQQGKMGAKALTEGVATGFVRISVPQGTTVGGFVKYSIEANDGVDFQCRSGLLPFSAVNKAGAETGTVGTPDGASEVVAVSAGTLTNTFTIASNAVDTMDILANVTSSLVQTTLRINYSVELYGNAIVTVTPL